ncbi:MAG: ankyrin repeat domain-containing protein [Acidobacteriota bacterium]
MTELTDAIKAGQVARVNALVDADASLLEAAENGVTPVLLAIYHGRREIADLLVARGAPVSFPEACALGLVSRAQEMLANDPSLRDARSADGFPATGLAIFFGHGELARWLIGQGADVHAAATNTAGVAPVHAAAAVCDHETMRLLLERGADPNARQQGQFTPLHAAASGGDVAMATLLLDHGARRDAKTGDDLTVADMARKYGKAEFAAWIETQGS